MTTSSERVHPVTVGAVPAERARHPVSEIQALITRPDPAMRPGRVRPEFVSVVEGVDLVPDRVSRHQVSEARALLDRDGAVILTGWPLEGESVVNAASAILGTRLRELEKIQDRTTENTAGSSMDQGSAGFLHRDGSYGLVNINDRLVPRRLADPDYVLILCLTAPPIGGQSVVIDGYRLIERLHSAAPELFEFITTVDIDFTSRYASPGYPRAPQLCRIVEWTRGGRKIVRSAENAQPAPRDPQWDQHDWLIQAWVDVCVTLGHQIRHDTTLAPGEVLVVDNYRCLHGVRDNQGRRTTYILRCRSQDAR